MLAGASLCLAFGAGHAPAAKAEENVWRITVAGGVVASVPKYPGSDRQRTVAAPFASASYGRFFIGGEPSAGGVGGIGVNLYRDSRWQFGAALSAGFARRRELDDPRLQGLGDVKQTASAVLGSSYTHDWFIVQAQVVTDILDRGQGTLARLDTLARYRPNERVTFSAGPGVTWANGEYMRTFFGVDGEQSVRSGLPQFEAKSGLESTRFSVSAGYQIDSHWGAGAFASYSRLRNDAAASPITQDQSQHILGAAVTYRFGNAAALRNPVVSQ